MKTRLQKPVLAAVLQELLNTTTFDGLGDLAEALKCEAARLRIPYDATRITEAIRAVGYTRPLVRATR